MSRRKKKAPRRRQKKVSHERRDTLDKRSTSRPGIDTWIDDDQERAAVFQQLEASPEFDARQSPERLARLPRREKLFDIRFVYAYVFVSVMFSVILVVTAKADLFQQFLSLVFGLTVFGTLIFGTAAAIVIFRRGDSGTVDRADVTALPVIVTGKRGGDEFCYATFMNSQDKCFEHLLWNKKLSEKFYMGDAGIVFVWKDKAVGFDKVLTSQVLIESHVQGAVECLHCESVYRLGTDRCRIDRCQTTGRCRRRHGEDRRSSEIAGATRLNSAQHSTQKSWQYR